MSYSTSRLTLYVLLSSIEEDLRDAIVGHLAPQLPIADLLGPELSAKLLGRARAEDAVVDGSAALESLLVYADFGDLYQLLNTHRTILPGTIGDHVRVQSATFEKLIPIRNRVAHARPLHFDDLAFVADVATELANSADFGWPALRETVRKLEADPSYVLGVTIPTYENPTESKHNLPTPDFDETGFLGRKQQVAELIKLCNGQWPVITVVGDGGIGKTALALKVAYDILDAPDCRFEAVVWTSSKTAQLTANEIIRIKGSISDSLGMIANVASRLGGSIAAEPVEEVLAYLGTFRILLILDNLETVLDERIRSFLERLPAGSKILITSRIGLGAFEFPYKLQPMTEGESVQLVRALAKTRQARDLVKMQNSPLAAYCARMHNNPGFIKWFVAAVQAGRRPEDVLQNPHLFLDFCMSNVYEYLSEDSRSVLRGMLCVPGRHSQAQLAFLTRLDVLPLQRSLQQLLTTNMVVMSSVPRGSSFESQYEISDLARAYLGKHHPVSADESKLLTSRRNQLVRAGEQFKEDQDSNPFSGFSIAMRSNSDLIVAKYLHDALRCAHRNDYTQADALIARARSLAPEFFEVHRVDGWVKSKQGNVSAAHESYEAAVELEPKSAPLRFFYGGFLLRYGDIGKAVSELGEALALEPHAAAVKLELARAALYAMRFARAREVLDSLISRADISEWVSRKAYDLHLQYFIRLADYYMGRHDYSAALTHLRSLKEAYLACPPPLLDAKMRIGLGRAMPSARLCAVNIGDAAARGEAADLVKWLADQASGERRDGEHSETLARSSGRVVRMNRERGYAFILMDNGDEVRAEPSSFRSRNDWAKLQAGAVVSFRLVRARQGARAMDAIPGE